MDYICLILLGKSAKLTLKFMLINQYDVKDDVVAYKMFTTLTLKWMLV